MSGPAGMRTAALLLMLLPLPPVRVFAVQSKPTPIPSTPQRDVEVLRRLEEEYLRAEIEDDTAIAGTILADDYVGLKPDGSTISKSDVLNRLGRHERRREPYLITATNMRQHLFGDTASVTYTKVYTKPGSQTAFSENVLHLLIRRDGIWRLQLSSPLPAPKP
jgi:ribosomal protein S24E